MNSYIIEKGKHYPKGIHFDITFKNEVRFKCKFDKSCLYYFDDIDDFDINKLCGFSTSWFHHKQSARIGWRCIGGKSFEIVTYSYNDGTRELKETDVLGIVSPDEEFEVIIEDKEDYYFYFFIKKGQDAVAAMDVKKKDWFPFNYILFPYFGGNRPAPHTMNLYVKRLKSIN